VILAMGDGKKASDAIHEYLMAGGAGPKDGCDAEAGASNVQADGVRAAPFISRSAWWGSADSRWSPAGLSSSSVWQGCRTPAKRRSPGRRIAASFIRLPFFRHTVWRRGYIPPCRTLPVDFGKARIRRAPAQVLCVARKPSKCPRLTRGRSVPEAESANPKSA